MVLMVILCLFIISVVIYVVIMYYYLLCKEKSARDTGIFTTSDPDMYIPKEKKKNAFAYRFGVAGLFIGSSKRRKHKEETDIETKDEKRPDAFKDTNSDVGVENVNFEDEKKEPHSKEERSVHFEDQKDCDDHRSNTYHRSEEVDHGYGTLAANDQGDSSWE